MSAVFALITGLLLGIALGYCWAVWKGRDISNDDFDFGGRL